MKKTINKEKWCERLQNLTIFIFIALEIAALVFFYVNGYITGFKGIVHSVFFVLLSIPCFGIIKEITAANTLHFIFLISRIVLANHMFNKDIPKILLTVVIMSAVTWISKLINLAIEKIFGKLTH